MSISKSSFLNNLKSKNASEDSEKINEAIRYAFKLTDMYGIERINKSILEASIEFKIDENLDLILVAGPKIKDEFDNEIRNLGFVQNLHEVIFAADLVISLAGKSTIDESIIYGTPGIFIPIKDHFEQEDNAKEMGFDFNNIFNLEELIKKSLNTDRCEPQENGVDMAGMEITKILLKENND